MEPDESGDEYTRGYITDYRQSAAIVEFRKAFVSTSEGTAFAVVIHYDGDYNWKPSGRTEPRYDIWADPTSRVTDNDDSSDDETSAESYNCNDAEDDLNDQITNQFGFVLIAGGFYPAGGQYGRVLFGDVITDQMLSDEIQVPRLHLRRPRRDTAAMYADGYLSLTGYPERLNGLTYIGVEDNGIVTADVRGRDVAWDEHPECQYDVHAWEPAEILDYDDSDDDEVGHDSAGVGEEGRGRFVTVGRKLYVLEYERATHRLKLGRARWAETGFDTPAPAALSEWSAFLAAEQTALERDPRGYRARLQTLSEDGRSAVVASHLQDQVRALLLVDAYAVIDSVAGAAARDRATAIDQAFAPYERDLMLGDPDFRKIYGVASPQMRQAFAEHEAALARDPRQYLDALRQMPEVGRNAVLDSHLATVIARELLVTMHEHIVQRRSVGLADEPDRVLAERFVEYEAELLREYPDYLSHYGPGAMDIESDSVEDGRPGRDKFTADRVEVSPEDLAMMGQPGDDVSGRDPFATWDDADWLPHNDGDGDADTDSGACDEHKTDFNTG